MPIIDALFVFECGAYIEQWLLQQAIIFQHRGNQQASDAAIGISKWENGFKLCMHQRHPQQWRDVVRWCVNEAFEGGQRVRRFMGRRRYEYGIAGVGAAYPILRLPN